MALKYPHLFQPYRIGKLSIKNRIAMAPMHLGGRMDSTGNMTEEVIDYYEARAKGGFGLIITGGVASDGGSSTTAPDPETTNCAQTRLFFARSRKRKALKRYTDSDAALGYTGEPPARGRGQRTGVRGAAARYRVYRRCLGRQ